MMSLAHPWIPLSTLGPGLLPNIQVVPSHSLSSQGRIQSFLCSFRILWLHQHNKAWTNKVFSGQKKFQLCLASMKNGSFIFSKRARILWHKVQKVVCLILEENLFLCYYFPWLKWVSVTRKFFRGSQFQFSTETKLMLDEKITSEDLNSRHETAIATHFLEWTHIYQASFLVNVYWHGVFDRSQCGW